MEDQLTSPEVANLAKEKRYDWLTRDYIYHGDTGNNTDRKGFSINGMVNDKLVTVIPTQSLLQRWLREKHEIIVFVTILVSDKLGIPFKNRKYDGNIVIKGNRFHKKGFPTYEEALEAGLKEALSLIKLNTDEN